MSRLLTAAVVLALWAPVPTLAQDAPAPQTTTPATDLSGSSVTTSLTLRVSDRREAAKAAVELAESQGGWFSNFTPELVTLRVPTNDTAEVLESLAKLGDVIGKDYQRQDHSAEIAELTARITGRETVLEKYMAVLATARAKSVVSVEREITNAIAELERLKGRRRYLNAKLAHSQITVRFRFQDRSAPRRDGNSSFAWLNTMNVADMERDFQQGRRATPSRVQAVAPDGFAPYRRPRKFQAVSPDDVLFRVRSVRHKPKADLEFWREALKTRMVEAGYTVVDEQTTAGKTYILELGAANGAKDQTYMVGVRLTDWHLVLIEATGEAEAFRERHDAVLAAFTAIED